MYVLDSLASKIFRTRVEIVTRDVDESGMTLGTSLN